MHGLYCVANYNWDFLPDSYFIYPPEFNAFLQLIVGRPTFCCNIYKTSVYKKVQYHPEKYGKLHDICFMFDVGQYGDLIFLHGECVRWRQHVSSDSNSLKTGPFPNEVVNIIAHIQEVYLHERPVKGLREHIRYTFVKTLIFNFSYFLYNWSDLKRYLTWDQMKDELIKQNVFSTKDYRTYDRIIDVFLNPIIRKLSKNYMHKYSRPYSYRVENL